MKKHLIIALAMVLTLTMVFSFEVKASGQRTETIILTADDMGYSSLSIDNVRVQTNDFPCKDKINWSWSAGDDVYREFYAHFALSDIQIALIESADSYTVTVDVTNSEYPAGGLWTYFVSGNKESSSYYVDLYDYYGWNYILKDDTQISYDYNYARALTDIELTNSGMSLDELWLHWAIDGPAVSTSDVVWAWRCTDVILTIDCVYDDPSVPSSIYTEYGIHEIITPDISDALISDNFQSDVSDKSNQSSQLVQDSTVNKPDISDDDLNPMDKVDEDDLNTMSGVIGAVYASPTLLSISILTLVFALIGYILYGKR